MVFTLKHIFQIYLYAGLINLGDILGELGKYKKHEKMGHVFSISLFDRNIIMETNIFYRLLFSSYDE